MTEKYTVPMTQYLRPDGRTKGVETDLPNETLELFKDMIKCGCRFEVEELRTGEVSVTISTTDPYAKDIDISVTENGPAVQAGMVAMLERKLWKGEGYEG
jgi:hypothetical protein